MLARVREAAGTLPQATVDAMAASMREDAPLLESLRSMVDDQDLPDLQRLNALVVANRLMPPKLPRNRSYCRHRLDDAELVGPSLNAVTFMKGRIDRVTFRDAYFGGVVWTRSPLNSTATA